MSKVKIPIKTIETQSLISFEQEALFFYDKIIFQAYFFRFFFSKQKMGGINVQETQAMARGYVFKKKLISKTENRKRTAIFVKTD